MNDLKTHKELSRSSKKIEQSINTKHELSIERLEALGQESFNLHIRYQELANNLHAGKRGLKINNVYLPDLYYDWSLHLSAMSDLMHRWFETTEDMDKMNAAIQYQDLSIEKIEQSLKWYEVTMNDSYHSTPKKKMKIDPLVSVVSSERSPETDYTITRNMRDDLTSRKNNLKNMLHDLEMEKMSTASSILASLSDISTFSADMQLETVEEKLQGLLQTIASNPDMPNRTETLTQLQYMLKSSLEIAETLTEPTPLSTFTFFVESVNSPRANTGEINQGSLCFK